MAEALPHEDQPMNLSLSPEPKASPGNLASAPFQSNGDWEHEALEQQFLDGLAVTMSTAVSALRPVVLRLVSMGATRTHLVAIAAERGYKKAYVRTLLSEILIRNGGRQREPGAGPKRRRLQRSCSPSRGRWPVAWPKHFSERPLTRPGRKTKPSLPASGPSVEASQPLLPLS